MPSGSATTRALLSATPPGETGTMMRSGFAGHSWAGAVLIRISERQTPRTIRIESRAPLCAAALHRRDRRALLLRRLRRRRRVPPLGSMADQERRRQEPRPRALRSQGAGRRRRRRPLAARHHLDGRRSGAHRKSAERAKKLSAARALPLLARPQQQQFRRLGARPCRHPVRFALEGFREEMVRLTVREAKLADASAIAEIHVAAWRAAYRGMIADEYLASLSIGERTGRWPKAISAPGPAKGPVAQCRAELLASCSFGPTREP